MNWPDVVNGVLVALLGLLVLRQRGNASTVPSDVDGRGEDEKGE